MFFECNNTTIMRSKILKLYLKYSKKCIDLFFIENKLMYNKF